MNPCIAHRGWSGRAPENTLAAIGLALEEEGISKIEMDVHLTKDRKIVVAHDYFLGRTSNGKGLIKDHTYEELAKLDFGGWFSEEYIGEKIPLLEDVFTLVDGKKDLVIEVKSAGDLYSNFEEILVKTLKDYHYRDTLWIKSFDHVTMKKIKKIDMGLKTGLLMAGRETLLMEQIHYTWSDFVSIAYPYLNQDLFHEIKKAGVAIMTWTVDEPRDIEKIKALSKEIMIITNYPDRVYNG